MARTASTFEAIGIAVGHFDKARRDVILADFDKEFPQWNDKVADLVWELQPPSVLPTLGERIADKSLTPAQRGRIVDILAVADNQAGGASLLKVLETDVPQEVRDKVMRILSCSCRVNGRGCAAARIWPSRFRISSPSRRRALPE